MNEIWSQGHILSTEQTRHWTQDEWDKNEARERRAIFTHFYDGDDGRSRKFIAATDTPEVAEFIVATHNQHDTLLELIRDLADWDSTTWVGNPKMKQLALNGLINRARAILEPEERN